MSFEVSVLVQFRIALGGDSRRLKWFVQNSIVLLLTNTKPNNRVNTLMFIHSFYQNQWVVSSFRHHERLEGNTEIDQSHVNFYRWPRQGERERETKYDWVEEMVKSGTKKAYFSGSTDPRHFVEQWKFAPRAPFPYLFACRLRWYLWARTSTSIRPQLRCRDNANCFVHHCFHHSFLALTQSLSWYVILYWVFIHPRTYQCARLSVGLCAEPCVQMKSDPGQYVAFVHNRVI